MTAEEILQFIVAFASAAPKLAADAVAFFNALVAVFKGNAGLSASTLQTTLDSVYNATKATLSQVEGNQ